MKRHKQHFPFSPIAGNSSIAYISALQHETEGDFHDLSGCMHERTATLIMSNRQVPSLKLVSCVMECTPVDNRRMESKKTSNGFIIHTVKKKRKKLIMLKRSGSNHSSNKQYTNKGRQRKMHHQFIIDVCNLWLAIWHGFWHNDYNMKQPGTIK